ncbi:MAG: hypothetical protein GX558_12255 [Clostridiales bacterium]|nr:hypothetical protein [Clostridiales bacterium]
MTERENYLRNARFQRPEWIPVSVHINESMWTRYGAELSEVIARHPALFPGGPRDAARLLPYDRETFFDTGKTRRDAWGCLWGYPVDGMDGIVVEEPLADWANFDDYRFPDPETENDRQPRDWAAEARAIALRRGAGRLTYGSLAHGFMLLRITYLRGFENAMLDFMDDEPNLARLIRGIEAHSRHIVSRYLGMGVDVMEFPEDLGTQQSLIVSPATMRKWILPVYRRLMEPVRRAGCLVGFHSDGRVLEILGELIDAGVDIVNPQDLVNGIDDLAREVKGRACIRLDVDRQKIIPFGTRREIEELIEEEVRKLGSPEGGLEMIVGVYPPTPPENLDALCQALTKYQRWWWR